MKKILILFFALCSFQLYSTIELFHIQPEQADVVSRLQIDVRSGSENIESAFLYYRFNSGSYQELAAEEFYTNSLYLDFNLPHNVKNDFEYFFKVTDKDGTEFFLPKVEPQNNPYRLDVVNRVETGDDRFVLLAPVDDVISDKLLIAVSYAALSNDINTESVVVTLNGRNVSKKSVISENMLIYKDNDAASGEYKVKITALSKNGSTLSSPEWGFSFKGKQKSSNVKFTGRGTLKIDYDTTTDKETDKTSDDLQSYFLLNTNGRYKKLRFRTKMYISSRESGQKQPVNRFNLDLKLPYFRAVFGDYSTVYNSLILNGKNVRGMYTSFTAQGFGLYGTYGISQRAVTGKELIGSSEATIISSNNKAFERRSLAVRLELGSRNNFLIGFNFAQSRDVKDSLKRKYISFPDEDFEVVAPEDNLVVGADLTLSLLQKRLVWGNEVGFSFFNNNIMDGATSQDSLENEFDTDIPFNPEDWEWLFIINKNMQPIIPNKANLAYKSYLRMMLPNNILNISYSVVGACYHSQLTNYLQSDARKISVNDNLMLMRNRLNLSAGFNLIVDNLSENKTADTSTLSYNLSASYRPENLPYFGLGYNNSKSVMESDEDESEFSTTGVNLMFGYKLQNFTKHKTDLNLTYSNSFNEDLSEGSFENNSNNITLSAKSIFNDFPLTTRFAYSFSVNDNKSKSETDGTSIKEDKKYQSIYLKGSMRFLQESLIPYLEYRISSYDNIEDNDFMHNLNLGGSFKYDALTQLILRAGSTFFNGLQEYTKYNLMFKISRSF